MRTNYIYLLQEREFIKTNENIYKVGRTKKENYKRFNQYPKGSVLLFQMICNNCENIERDIIEKFKKKFNQRKDIGNEYFEGDYKTMIDIIYNIIKNEICIDIKQIQTDEIVLFNLLRKNIYDLYNNIIPINFFGGISKFNLLCKKSYEFFPDYKNDESFGGVKKFIKINLINNNYVIYYLRPKLMEYNYMPIGGINKIIELINLGVFNNNDNDNNNNNNDNDNNNYNDDNDYKIDDDDFILKHVLNKYVGDDLQYFNNILIKEIELDKIYDINSIDFIKKINDTKLLITIENYNKFKIFLNNLYLKKNIKFDCEIEKKINQLFYCNMLINNELYTTMFKKHDNDNVIETFNKFKDLNQFLIDVGNTDYCTVKIYKINTKFYHYESYLLIYIPYILIWDQSGNYYIINREYDYIGMDNNKLKLKGRLDKSCYLFNGRNTPWSNKQQFINMCNKYEKIIKDNQLKNCLNLHEFTKNILSSFN